MSMDQKPEWRGRGRPDDVERPTLQSSLLAAAIVLFFSSLAIAFGWVWSRLFGGRRAVERTLSPGSELLLVEKKPVSHYEKSRLRGRPFVVGAISFFAFCALMYGAVWMLLGHWTSQRVPWRHQPAPAWADVRWNTESPQVQINPSLDLEKVRRIEGQRLHALHWNDAAHGYATIPVEQAMQLMVQAASRGQLSVLLPAPQPATPLDLQDQKSRETSPPQVPNP